MEKILRSVDMGSMTVDEALEKIESLRAVEESRIYKEGYRDAFMDATEIILKPRDDNEKA